MGKGHCRVSAAQLLANRTRPDIGSPSGLLMVVGGPAMVEYIRPTDEELRERYNPDLKKRSVEQGERRAQEFDDYVSKLKEWSKSDKSSMSPISWEACLPDM
jgi:hypothetical protein